MTFQATFNSQGDIHLIVNERNMFTFAGVKGKPPTFDRAFYADLAKTISETVDPLTEEPIGEVDMNGLKAALDAPISTDEQTALSQEAKGR